MKEKVYKRYCDPGHSWLAVKYIELIELCIVGQISEYSFVNGSTVYLEEDCDMSKFIDAYEKKYNKKINIKEILLSNPDTLFWLPTRAWRNKKMRNLIEKEIMSLKNARILASVDPTTQKQCWRMLKNRKWSTMFFGNNKLSKIPIGDKFHKCKKTWNKEKKACVTCKNGCFSSKQVNIHLRKH
jgi:hypothetical protein